jgi:hypothetical protein
VLGGREIDCGRGGRTDISVTISNKKNNSSRDEIHEKNSRIHLD